MVHKVSTLEGVSSEGPPNEDAVQVQRWLRLLLNRWGILAAGAVIGALLGALASVRTPPLYEAAATVLLTPPVEQPRLFNVAAVRAILNGQTIASQVVEELRKTGRYGGSAQTFLTQEFSLEEVPTTDLFRLRVRLTDPELAARAATLAAERGVQLIGRVWQETAMARRTQLERQMEQARLALGAAEEQLTSAMLRAGLRPVPRSTRIANPRQTSAEIDRLETEVEVRRKVYIDIGARHEQSRIELASAAPPLRLVDAATAPDRPLPGGRGRTVALGLLAGLIVAACAVVAREWREQGAGAPLAGASL